MGKHDDGRRYLNHSYHVPWAHQKVQIDWMSIGNKTVNLVVAPTLINTPRQMWKNAWQAKHCRGQFGQWGLFTVENFFLRLESWYIDEKMPDTAEPSQRNLRRLLDVRFFLWWSNLKTNNMVCKVRKCVWQCVTMCDNVCKVRQCVGQKLSPAPVNVESKVLRRRVLTF